MSHSKVADSVLSFFLEAWGPFLESPETLRAIFGCHNSGIPLYLKNGVDLNSSNFTVIFHFVTLKTR